MHVRAAAAADAQTIVTLVNSAYHADPKGRAWTTERDLVEGRRTNGVEIAARIGRPGGGFLIAEDPPGTVVGCAYWRREGEKTAHLGMLSVAPDAQAGGIGSRLMTEVESSVRGWGATCINLTVLNKRPELIAFYERRGYAVTGATHPFPASEQWRLKKQSTHFIEMEKPL